IAPQAFPMAMAAWLMPRWRASSRSTTHVCELRCGWWAQLADHRQAVGAYTGFDRPVRTLRSFAHYRLETAKLDPHLCFHARIECVQRANDFRLAVPRNIAIARKCRQHVLVAEVLGPGFVFLG